MISGIKSPSAIIVSGLARFEKDEEILNFLKQYGSINRILTVDDNTSEFNKNVVVEYNSGTPLHALGSLLPYYHLLPDSPDVTYCVRALADVYIHNVGASVTDTYLSELRGITKLSRKVFVLKEVMSKINKSIGVTGPSDHHSHSQPAKNPEATEKPSKSADAL